MTIIHKTKRRIVITGCRPDTNPAYRAYQNARRKFEILVDAGIDRHSRYFVNAIRRTAKARLHYTHLMAKASACRIIIAQVPYKRPGRKTERDRTINEQLKEAICFNTI